jgi:hypothetical protein
MTAEEWIRRFAKELEVEPPSEGEMAELLDLAAVAAHASERRAAPLACWLAAAAGRASEELMDIARGIGED